MSSSYGSRPMAGDIDRKKLWGRSASRCAKCRVELTLLDGMDAIVGDEAHIRSRQPGGPRHDPCFPKEDLDRYGNLILLCKAHHKLVDDNAEVFTTDVLLEMKASHERRVVAALAPPTHGWQGDILLEEVSNGTRLMDHAHATMAYDLRNDHPETDAERAIVPAFLQSVTDWAEISDEIGPGGRAQGAQDLHQQMTELHDLGLVVLAANAPYRHPQGLQMPGLVVRVLRRSTLEERLAADEAPE